MTTTEPNQEVTKNGPNDIHQWYFIGSNCKKDGSHKRWEVM